MPTHDELVVRNRRDVPDLDATRLRGLREEVQGRMLEMRLIAQRTLGCTIIGDSVSITRGPSKFAQTAKQVEVTLTMCFCNDDGSCGCWVDPPGICYTVDAIKSEPTLAYKLAAEDNARLTRLREEIQGRLEEARLIIERILGKQLISKAVTIKKIFSSDRKIVHERLCICSEDYCGCWEDPPGICYETGEKSKVLVSGVA